MDAYERVVTKGQKPETDLERVLVDLGRTRRSRWERFSSISGMPVPDAFHVHRGVRGEYAVEGVVRAWADERSATLAVPSRPLASWSLDPTVAPKFGDDPAASVIYEAKIPFEQTFLDKWADGGMFVTLLPDQEEVVVAATRELLSIPKNQAKVLYRGRTYTYDDRQALIQAWTADHPAAA